MGRLWVSLALVAAGCGGDTSLTVGVSLAEATPAPASLRVSAYGAGRIGTPHTLALAGRTLPGVLVLHDLDPTVPDFRVVVDGLDAAGALRSQAGARAGLDRNRARRIDVQLQSGLPDSDGDGVPDVVDDCPGADDALPSCAPPANGDFGGALDLAGSAADLTGVTGDLAAASCGTGAVLCEGFESGFAAPPWSAATGQGGASSTTVAADAFNPHTGARSAHTVVLTGAQGEQWREAAFTPITSGTFALRAFVWFGATPTASSWVLDVGSTTNIDGSGYNLGANLMGGTTYWEAYLRSSGVHHTSNFAPTGGHWICLELVHDLATHLTTLWIDKQQAVSVTETSSPPTSFDRVFVGATYSTTQPIDLYVDDLAIGRQRFDDCP